MYHIVREIQISYGHRLLNHPGKCGKLHGHNGIIEVELSAKSLNEQKMVMDFYDVKQVLQTWIDETLDHQMILSKDDPAVPVLQKAGEKILVISDNPTAETLSRLVFDYAVSQGLPVSKVTWRETPACAAVYHRE